MGIKNFNKIIQKYAPTAVETKNIKEYKNLILTVDVSQIIYKSVIAIRGTGKDLSTGDAHMSTNKVGCILENRMSSHIIGLINKSLCFLRHKCLPIYVFDKKAHHMKSDTLKHRRQIKETAKENITDITNIQEDEIKYFKRSFGINDKITQESQEVLDLLGIKYLVANDEADHLCAYLTNISYGVVSDDTDILTHGATILLKNFSFNPKEKIQEINLDKLLKKLKLSRDEFIDLCILLGTDYNSNPPGIGPISAYNLITKHRNLETIEETMKLDFDYKKIRQIFKEEYTQIYTKEEFYMTKPKYNKLRILLKEKYNFSEKTINNIIIKLKKYFDELKFKNISSSYFIQQ